MRIIIFILAITSFISVRAQTLLPVSGINYMQQGAFSHYNLMNHSNRLQKKWSVSTYGGMGAGVGFFNGGNVAFLHSEMGLQLNRRLNNNLYAFAGVSAAPVFFNFNRSFSNADLYKNGMANPGFNANGWGIYPGIQAGLMYVNDEKTFSISGSIGISSSSYPFYPSTRINTQKQSSFTGSRQ
jgi:hypothetical protein